MKDKIREICYDLEMGCIDWTEASEQLFALSDDSQHREMLVDFMKKTQGNLIWGWSVGGGEKLADEYLKGNL